MARDCTMPDTCRKCNQEGHLAKDCDIPDTCRKCKQEGHMAKDCEIPDKCMKCKEEGHLARDCHLPDKCRNCGAEGHIARDCSEPIKCKLCGEEGHKASECEKEEQTREIQGEDGEMREIYVPKATADDELYGSHITSGINFAKYEDIPVDVKGDKVPKAIENFNCGLRQLLMDNIAKSGYKVPTPIQKNAIPIVLANRDLMACAQTGSGKTAAFMLPIVHTLLEEGDFRTFGFNQSPKAVVVSPTRELTIQIWEQARKFSCGSTMKCSVLYGGTSVSFQRKNIEKGVDILVATPGRLLDFVEKGIINFTDLKYLVFDEADRMLDMGFGPDMEKCVENPTMPPKEKRTTLMFSATFPDDVQEKARDYLKKDKIFLSVGLIGATCSDVKQTFIQLEKKEKNKKLDEILNDPQRDPAERVMIFVNTKKTADFLATKLSSDDKPTTSIHGDRKQREREEALYDFKTGTRPILVATAVAARGLDIPEVNHVINYEMPNDVDEYVHRIGRTGRVGNIGKATSFYDPDRDGEVSGKLVELLSKCQVEVPDFLTGGFSSVGGGGGDGDGAEDDDW